MNIGIGIVGVRGRMGQALVAALENWTGAYLAGGIDVGAVAGDLDCHVLVDFSSPDALADTLAAAIARRRPIVIGSTGLDEGHHAAIDAAAQLIPVLQSANMSLGVTLLARLVSDAAEKLGPDWDIEILEMHHRHKIDAPSGTALLLAEAAAAGRGIDLAKEKVTVRDGVTGPRREGSIGFASLRGGSVPGDHSVIFATEDERLELSHKAQSRAIFARGAIRAAQWLADKPAGRYSLTDVLDLDRFRMNQPET